ncbi:unnamed protein product [Lasius platythorax]|uniref:Uncharacterized protein n=1 Tax=Lasius platythorax TaxID=488582 RepID=A0AAV2NR94_9HYME
MGRTFLINLSLFRIEETQEIIMLSQATLFVNFEAETILRIRAKITNNNRIADIVTKSDEMRDITDNEQTKTIFAVTDIFFLVPQGHLMLRRYEQNNKGSLIFYKKHYPLITHLPGSINSYECVPIDIDLTCALTWVLILPLHIKKQVNRVMQSFMLPDYTNIIIEAIPSIGNIIHIQVLVKSTQRNVNKSCNDALEMIKNLMQKLSITEDDLMSISDDDFYLNI